MIVIFKKRRIHYLLSMLDFTPGAENPQKKQAKKARLAFFFCGTLYVGRGEIRDVGEG